MEIGEVNKMLEQFYNGKTTEEQEEMLKEYFLSKEVPEEFLLEKKLFLNIHRISRTEVPVGLEDKLIQLIDRKQQEDKKIMTKNKSYPNWRWISGIAASVLLLIGLGYGMSHFQKHTTPEDTFTDPGVAYEVIQATLIEISSNLNDAMAQLTEVHEDVTKISDEIYEEIQ